MTFNTILGKMDRALDQKDKKELSYLYVMIIGVIFYLSYAYLFPFSEQVYEQNKRQIVSLKNNIRKDKIYLQSHTQNELRKISKDIAEHKKQVADLLVEKEYIEYELSSISYLYYNEKVWGTFLDSITQKAKKYGVLLKTISNNFVEKGSEFGHVLEIEIDAEASFVNLMHFLNSIEQSDLVVDVFELNMKTGNKISAHFNISVWGINH